MSICERCFDVNNFDDVSHSIWDGPSVGRFIGPKTTEKNPEN